jgi:hypothetical protein
MRLYPTLLVEQLTVYHLDMAEGYWQLAGDTEADTSQAVIEIEN